MSDLAIKHSQMEVICTRLAAGEQLTDICRDRALPTVAEIARWVADTGFTLPIAANEA